MENSIYGHRLACERRPTSGCRFPPPKRQPEIRLRSQARHCHDVTPDARELVASAWHDDNIFLSYFNCNFLLIQESRSLFKKMSKLYL